MITAQNLMLLTKAELMRSYYDKDRDERFIIVRIELDGLHSDEHDNPMIETFYIKIAAKHDSVVGYIECSKYLSCKRAYRKVAFDMYSVDLFAYMSAIYKNMLKNLKDAGELNTVGYIIRGDVIRKYQDGHIDEEIVSSFT